RLGAPRAFANGRLAWRPDRARSRFVAAPTIVTANMRRTSRMPCLCQPMYTSRRKIKHQGEVGMNKATQPVVYILDDDEEVRDVLSAVVQAAGHVAVSYSRPSQFLEKLDHATPGILI